MNSFASVVDVTQIAPIILSLVTTILTVVAGLTAVLTQIFKLRSKINLELKSPEGITEDTAKIIRMELESPTRGTSIPFEVEQLTSYYSLTLTQSRVSFWFSLIFAAIGFLVIVGAAFFYKEGDTASAYIKVLSGLIVDAVAALFFVQSKRAQDSMFSFFEKLRNDRQYVEARKMCEEILDQTTQDNLKTILVLHYSGIDTTSAISSFFALSAAQKP